MFLIFQTLGASWENVSNAYLQLYIKLIGFLPNLFSALFVILFTTLLSRFTRGVIGRAMNKTHADANISFLVVRSGSIVVWLIGIAVILSVLKIDMAGAFAAFGVTGAAIGFAIRDIIANFVAGVVLLSIQPFKIGDTVVIETYEGTVERVELRVMVLKLADTREVSIPNSKVFSSIIVKHTAQSTSKISFSLGLDTEVSFEHAKELILATISTVEGVATTPAPGISISSFAANVINIDIYCWVKESANLVTTSSQVKISVKEMLTQEQIALAPASSMTIMRNSSRLSAAN